MESNMNTARFLDMTDRVDVLSSIYRSCEGKEDSICFNAIMEEYYPALLHFYHECKKDDSVVFVQAFLEENAVTFVTTFEDGSCQDYHFGDTDSLLK